ncbi:MAG: hypothetical protein R3357_04295 [Burkholderiales bacterium]|nr:hypothetical protein [Burkholderiales bacterium]
MPARLALVAAFGLYGVWTFATWFFEGRIETLRRPDAVVDRLVYALVVNLALGIGAGAAYLAWRVRALRMDPARAGFGAWRRTVLAVNAGLILGSGAYVLQGAPSTDPIVVLNAYCQVLAVSAAEIVVCWCVAGVALEAWMPNARGALATVAAAFGAALLFGVYHFAHSAPFNTWGMVALLSAVGLASGAFFFVSRDALGSVVFHNFLGTFGVLRALAEADALAPLERIQPALVGTALATIALLLGAQVWMRRQRRSR